ncbi:hypothetical protein OKA04_03520 [Luteolibacter flavescens]|uniref:Uncharacterized protein n=1 Tax=Luteolibacter flavescens TaxID=1859460 RepID=A0ABT3FJR0_9BACT|nr:hypothetical protein [Luteolibacter flavescens]MCW1883782.1 hypothetical protein [Luteolibacter flavescens]
MNLDEAVEKIRRAGFPARKLHGTLGETVTCGSPINEVGINADQEALISLFPTNLGWGIHTPAILGETDYQEGWTLEEAADLAIGLLTSAHLPFRDEDLVITIARCQGGDGSCMDHTPTGLHRVLFMPGQGGRESRMTRDRAMREIALELARIAIDPK